MRICNGEQMISLGYFPGGGSERTITVFSNGINSVARPIDLDHIGTPVGEYGAGCWNECELSNFENADALHDLVHDDLPGSEWPPLEGRDRRRWGGDRRLRSRRSHYRSLGSATKRQGCGMLEQRK